MADHLVDTAGAVYGLGNLAALVAATPKRQRAALVREHATVIVTAQHRATPTTIEEISDIVYARVMSDEVVGDGLDLAPGLVVRACVDYPDSVATLSNLESFGGWAAVGPTALANLRRLPPPEHRTITARGGGVIHLLTCEDLFGASRLLLLDELFGSLLGIERPDYGVLVAVPHRHTVAVHIIEDATVVTALDAMVGLARSGEDAAGPVSPDVYYRDPSGVLQRVSRNEPDGSVQVEVSGLFEVAMSRIALPG